MRDPLAWLSARPLATQIAVGAGNGFALWVLLGWILDLLGDDDDMGW